MVMTKTDRFEPYLEPLFIPGFFGVVLYITAYSFIGTIWYGHWFVELPALVSMIGLIISTPTVLVYELLLLSGVLKPRTRVGKPEGFYEIARWIFGLAGVLSMAYAVYVVIYLWLHLPPPTTTNGEYDNAITIDN